MTDDPTPMPGGPFAAFLRDPGAAITDWIDRLTGSTAVIAVATLALVVLGARAGWRRWQHARMCRDARVVTVTAPPQVDEAGAAALWSNLTGLLRPAWYRAVSGQPHVCFEYLFSADGLHIRIWVPGLVPPGLVEHAIQGAWPGAQTRTAPARPPLPMPYGEHANLIVAGGRLRLAQGEALPLRTEFPADPLRALYGSPVPVDGADRAVVQVLARPVTGRRTAHVRRHGTRAAAARLPARIVSGALAGLLDVATTPARSRMPTPTTAAARRPGGAAHQTSLTEQARDRAIVAKRTGALYETAVRYAACSNDTDGNPRVVRDRLRGRAHTIASAFELFTGHNHYRRRRLHRPGRVLCQRRLGRGDLLSVAELAAVAHLPYDETVPGVERAGARSIAPVPAVPTVGEAIKPLGESEVGRARPVGLHVADARQHLHIMGATGSGKSELLGHLILSDATAGRGLVAVDPKGDLVDDVLTRLPDHAGKRTVLFDAGGRGHPPCLNPLQGDDPARTVDNLVSIFSRVYADSWGPRTDDVLRAGLLTLTTAHPGTPTLLDLPKLLTNPAYRARMTAQVTDPILAGFWTWYDELSEPARAQVIAPLMNKLRGFLLRPFVRDALTAGASTVNLADILDNGGLCLVRIPAGLLGAQTAHLFGSLVVAHTWQAATARADRPQKDRPDASLYLDEAHQFLHLPYALEDILAEARGYRLSVTLAHQNLAQLTRDLADGIAVNARTKIYFNTGPEDATRLSRHTGPVIAEHDLSRLGAFQAAVRPMVDNRETPAFTITTRKLPPPIPGRAKAIRAAARSATTEQTPPPRRPGPRRTENDPRRP